MILGGSNKFDYNKKLLNVKDINKILDIKTNFDNKNAHLKYSLVFFASNELERYKSNFDHIRIHRNITSDKMITLFEKSFVAILPSSTILLEAAAAITNIITFWYSDNQLKFHDYIVKNYNLQTLGDLRFADTSKILKTVDLLISVEHCDYKLSKELLLYKSGTKLLELFYK